MLRKAAAAAFCLAVSANAAFAACTEPRAVAALKIAALQQRLMVAGLTCSSLNGKGAGDSYNRFVLAHRAELQRSDDDLKAWFIANGGEAGYDSYKTRAANLAARGPATDRNAFCAATAGVFDDLARNGDLQQAAASEALLTGEACQAPVLAESRPVGAVRNAEVALAAPREMPAIPYAAAPPPLPVAVAREEVAAAPRAEEAAYAYAPPRPARSERYWYYRRLYARAYRYED